MQQKGEIIQFRIPAKPRHIAMVRKAIESLANSLDFADDATEDIELSVAEALTNAVEHGNLDHSGHVVVTCKICDDKLIIDVRDEGKGFRPSDCTIPELLSEHGRGLKLMHELMDDVRIWCNAKGSQVRLVKEKASHQIPQSHIPHI